MKKKSISTTFLLLALSTFVWSQDKAHTPISIDNRLYAAFDSHFLEKLIAENPFLLHRWNFYLDHSWYLSDLPAKTDALDYPTVQIYDLNKINIFVLERDQNIGKDWNRRMVFQIEGHPTKALVYYAGREFAERLNEHLNR